MTISTEVCSVTATGNGATTEFAFNFLIPYQSDGTTVGVHAFITVGGVDTTLVLGVDFSISGVGDADGGTVTYPLVGSPLAAPNTITINRDIDYVQPYEFLNQSFRPDQVEAAFDWVVMQIQQLNHRLNLLEE